MTKTRLILNCMSIICKVIADIPKQVAFVCKHEYEHYKMQNRLMNVAKDMEVNSAFARDYESLVGED